MTKAQLIEILQTIEDNDPDFLVSSGGYFELYVGGSDMVDPPDCVKFNPWEDAHYIDLLGVTP